MSKKADMSLRVIAGAIIILIVLSVLIYIFTQRIGESSEGYKSISEEAEEKAKKALEGIVVDGDSEDKEDTEETKDTTDT